MVFKFLLLPCLLFVVVNADESTTRSMEGCDEGHSIINTTWSDENMTPKVMAYVQQLINSSLESILPISNTSNWDWYCREVTSIQTCVVASNVPSEAENKQKELAVLSILSNIVCDAEIKNTFPCLVNVSQHPSDECQTRCVVLKFWTIQMIGKLIHNETRSFLNDHDIKSVCGYLRCRATCRKQDIVAACGQQGYEATKKILKTVGTLSQVLHTEFRPNGTLPIECTSEGLIREGN